MAPVAQPQQAMAPIAQVQPQQPMNTIQEMPMMQQPIVE